MPDNREKLPSGDVERVARALAEVHIRTVRRHDTEPAKLEAMMPSAIDYNWPDFVKPARAALSAMPDRQVGINEGLEMAAKVAEGMGADRIERNEDGSLRSYDMNCKHQRGDAVLNAMRVRAQTIANAIRAMKVEK